VSPPTTGTVPSQPCPPAPLSPPKPQFR
jgi:hypothetical protein